MYRELRLNYCGRQNCADMHSWGPGMRKSFIIHYIIRGAGVLECGGRPYRVECGQSFAVFPYTTVCYYPDPENPWEYTWVDFTGANAQQVMAAAGFTPARPVTDTAGSEAGAYYAQICALDFLDTQRHTADGLLQTILGLYIDAAQASRTAQSARAEEIQHLIHANYHKAGFCVNTLCALLNSSRVTVYRMFKQRFGTAPQRYILQYRLQQSAKMLCAGASVKEAAFSCGFSDPFYFSRQFKAMFGLPPAEYRRRNLPK